VVILWNVRLDVAPREPDTGDPGKPTPIAVNVVFLNQATTSSRVHHARGRRKAPTAPGHPRKGAAEIPARPGNPRPVRVGAGKPHRALQAGGHRFDPGTLHPRKGLRVRACRSRRRVAGAREGPAVQPDAYLASVCPNADLMEDRPGV
jgi:hypothetical protein